MKQILTILLIVLSSLGYSQTAKKYRVYVKNGYSEFYSKTNALSYYLNNKGTSIDTIIFDTGVNARKAKTITDSIARVKWDLYNKRKACLDSALLYIQGELNNDITYGNLLNAGTGATAFKTVTDNYCKGHKKQLIDWINNNYPSLTYTAYYTLERKKKLLKYLDW